MWWASAPPKARRFSPITCRQDRTRWSNASSVRAASIDTARSRGRRRRQAMPFRVVTLNLEQDHKRWAARRPLIIDELARLAPDLIAFNEVCVPLQSARDLRTAAAERTGHDYGLVQQTKVNSLSKEGEALLTRFPLIETGNLDYQTR